MKHNEKMEHTITISRLDLYNLIWSVNHNKDRIGKLMRKEKRLFPGNTRKYDYLFDRICELDSVLNILKNEWIGGESDER